MKTDQTEPEVERYFAILFNSEKTASWCNIPVVLRYVCSLQAISAYKLSKFLDLNHVVPVIVS